MEELKAIFSEKAKDEKQIKYIKQLFQEMDGDADGVITNEEFMSAMHEMMDEHNDYEPEDVE